MGRARKMKEKLVDRGMIYIAGVLLYLALELLTQRTIFSDWQQFWSYLVVYFLVGFEAFRDLCAHLLRFSFITDYSLIILATLGAFGIHRYSEGVFVMIVFEFGMLLEAVVDYRTRNRIQSLLDIRPEYANRKVNGKEVRVDPAELKVNHVIIVKPGERIPVDAVITKGASTVDTSPVTGEPIPRSVRVGDRIYGGCINQQGVIEARVTQIYKKSSLSRIMDMIEEAQDRKSESETTFSRFITFYTPVMVLAAAAVCIVPSLTFSYGNWTTWIYRGLLFLIAVCPGEILICVSLAFLGGIAAAARQGILIKGSNYLENLSRADTFIFDKTGTLTEGRFKVRKVNPVGMGEKELLKIAAHLECHSNHPIAQSLIAAYGGEIDKEKVSRVREIPGYGVSGTYEGERVHVGNRRLMEKQDVVPDDVTEPGTVVYVCVGKQYAGYILIADAIREDARWTLHWLKKRQSAVLVMLTGDSRESALDVADELDMDYAYADLLPEDKLEILEEFLYIADNSEKVVCVGDGINDAPVLARADVGIAMGALGSAAAIEAADVVLLEDELPKITDAIHISRAAMRCVNQNMIFSMVVKILLALLAVIGYMTMWEIILVDMAAMLVTMINAAFMVWYVA